jgi:hypothetical protein
MDTATEQSFADGVYRFWLSLPLAIELERKTGGKSLFQIFDDLTGSMAVKDGKPVYAAGGRAMVTDVREVIRTALIGGGSAAIDGQTVEIGPMRARELVDAYVFPSGHMIDGVVLAWQILNAAIGAIDLKKR